jgi:hypothetical protein
MITTGKSHFDVTLSYKTYEHLGNKGRSQLRREHNFKGGSFKTKAEAEQFAEVERERTGLDLRVQECTPIYGLL